MKKTIFLTFLSVVILWGIALAQDPADLTDDNPNLSSFEYKAIDVPFQKPPQPFFVYVRNQIVVKLKPEITASCDVRSEGVFTGLECLDALNKRYGVTCFEREFPDVRVKKENADGPDLSRYYILEFQKEHALEEVLEAYAECHDVESSEPIGVHPVYERIPNDPYFLTDQWNFYDAEDNDVDATDAWDHETGDTTVILGCLDSGVQYNSRDLGGLSPYTDGNVWINWDEYNGSSGIDDDGNGYVDDWIGWDFVNGAYPCWSGEDCNTQDNEPTDFNGHGTHVSGIMGAITNNGIMVAGLAGGWNETSSSPSNGVKIMPVRIGWSGPYGGQEVGYVRMDFAAQGFYYAVNNGATAINCSWGSSNTGGLGAAVDYAVANGVVVVAAAGNDNDQYPDYLGTRTDVINVAATNDSDHKAWFSDYGTWVDISAPGEDILSTYSFHYNPNYIAWLDGTSQAAPHVTAAAGLLKSYRDTLTRDQIIDLLLTYTDYIDDINPSYAGLLGSGRLNVYKAIDGVEAPAVTVIQPNGGEVLYIGQTYTVMWDASDNVGIDSCVIDYSVNSGVDWTYLATVPGNPGEWDWVVCGPASTTCRMRVTCYDAVGLTGDDMSDGDFCPPYKVVAKDFAIVGPGNLPTEFALHQNYPNPFNPATEIGFALPEASTVKLEVFNILGQRVITLIDAEMEAGEHTAQWDASDVSSGVYLYRLEANDFVSTKKMVLLK
jgi:subtilisin family serine protease